MSIVLSHLQAKEILKAKSEGKEMIAKKHTTVAMGKNRMVRKLKSIINKWVIRIRSDISQR